ncbi:hypothetical protein RRG08_016223 [Elysia crispata]|uniref:Uncharacterized protein n=1 Tax=Elysia crispata TaxID=231223 RepID=A0AAE0ZPB9_9GAST|nr:hypothetical protein RRG08_016223 [Elysia crispata]
MLVVAGSAGETRLSPSWSCVHVMLTHRHIPRAHPCLLEWSNGDDQDERIIIRVAPNADTSLPHQDQPRRSERSVCTVCCTGFLQ